ncbi:MAG: UDP-N-acetylmuramoyl-L-alanyl-D-glutamate--2,6-diaminopimelate ligase [Gemmatimonadales bacterium]|nr:UDP-N-acetylmuramoyl-L-alanyl-D-glutamate--2,6-diaminopimelate ligase [Gemmatimonadales bacterium]
MTATLDTLLAALRAEGLLVQAPADAHSPTALTADSRAVTPGAAYVAVRGAVADGHAYLADAARRGAGLAFVEAPQPVALPQVVVRDGRRAAIVLGRAWHGDPGAALALVGVTGTNGKTTTTGLVRHLLNAHRSAGSIGTLGAFDGAGEPVPSTAGNLTTPGPIDLQATLAALRGQGCTHVAMEASSHALDQGRLDGLALAAGVYTNLTRDHLDYHGTMEAYRAAKLKLSTLLRLDGWEVVNADDRAWDALPPRERRVTWGTDPAADVRATALELGASGSRFRIAGRFGEVDASIPLLGDFNVMNGLAAVATGLALGQPLELLARRLAESPQVPGRMEVLVDEGFVVLRDYAHTPDALERALRTLRPLTRGRLIVVFGAGGDRDRGKRPIMGRLAAELSDLAVVTSDNPRTEDPERILDDIVAGMASAPRVRLADRRVAIAAALEAARPGDTVLLAGKGHETYQVIGTDKLPFDEREIVRGLLAA